MASPPSAVIAGGAPLEALQHPLHLGLALLDGRPQRVDRELGRDRDLVGLPDGDDQDGQASSAGDDQRYNGAGRDRAGGRENHPGDGARAQQRHHDRGKYGDPAEPNS
jgi:hypothetical protein